MSEAAEVLAAAVSKGMELSWRTHYVPSPEAFRKYNGMISEDITSYLKAFERWSKPQKWEEKRKAEILPIFLSGRAAQFYELLSDEVKNDWELLCKALTDRFLPKLSREIALEALRERTQGESETSQELADDISRLSRLAFSGGNYSEKAKDEVTKTEYLRALHPDISYSIRMNDQSCTLTFDQTVERAAWLEASYQQTHQEHDDSDPWTDLNQVQQIKKLEDEVRHLQRLVGMETELETQ